MKKLLLAALLFATSANAASVSIGGGGSSSGMGSSATAAWPWSGTCALVVDDGFAWTYDDLLPLLIEINDDYGLTNTAWEMHATSGINPRNYDEVAPVAGNGIQGYQGQTGGTSQMTVAEVRLLNASGLFEIASHSQHHFIIDPAEVPTNPGRVSAPWPVAGIADSTATTEIRDSFYAIQDTIGVPVESFVCPGHKLDDLGMQIAGRYYKNVRVGELHYAAADGEFPNTGGSTNNNSTNIERGYTLHFNRTNLDPMAYWWWHWNPLYQGIVMPFTPMNRLNMPHLTPPANGSSSEATNILQTKKMLLALAEAKAFGILTWHDHNLDPPAGVAAQNIDGLVGVEEILRYAASLAANGLLCNDGPKLQMLMIKEAVNKKNSSLSHIDGAINVMDNFRMAADLNSDFAGTTAAERPWGYPDSLTAVWSDSGYAYIQPESTAVAGGYFGYFNDSGIIACPKPGTATNDGVNFKSLVMIYPVIPGSYARISGYAWADSLTSGTPNDSLSACWINVDVIPMRFNMDATDSLASWVRTPGTPRMLEQNVEIGEMATSDYVGTGAGSALSYSSTRMQKRFHSHDAGDNLRAQTYTTWYSDGNSTGAADRDQRWRSFNRDYVVPQDAYWLRVEYRPTGWTVASSDSLAFAGLECQLTPR